MVAFEAYKAAGGQPGIFIYDEEGLEERQRYAARASGLDEGIVRQRHPHLEALQLVRRYSCHAAVCPGPAYSPSVPSIQSRRRPEAVALMVNPNIVVSQPTDEPPPYSM